MEERARFQKNKKSLGFENSRNGLLEHEIGWGSLVVKCGGCLRFIGERRTFCRGYAGEGPVSPEPRILWLQKRYHWVHRDWDRKGNVK